MKLRILTLVAVAALMSSGCVYTKYTGKNGVSMTRISLFGNQTVGKVDLEKGTISGYSSEQTQAAEAIAEGVARGISSAATPR